MLKKLFNGEYALRATFWKFGIFGLVILYYAYKMLRRMAGSNADGYGVINAFRNLNVTGVASLNVFWLLAYWTVALFAVIYSCGIIKAVFKTAANYEKSIWLAQLARIGILVAVAWMWYMIIYG
ncbi:MAG: hypothetical protein IJ529_01275 [Alphaproteobacteria bacterium]|nr:hypothetical protein [Alphaproteobacteria bacterium]MBQ9234925.1 hypothetical protein [Alphaproteobacteria bacterium]